MFLFLLPLFTPVSVRSQWASYIEPSNNPNDLRGMLFNERSKFFSIEIFIRVDFWYRFRLTTSLCNRTLSNLFNVFHQCGNYLRCFALLCFPVPSLPTVLVLILTGCFFKLIRNFRNHNTTY